MRLDKITTRTVQQVIGRFLKGDENKGYKPMSAKTVKNYISYMSSVLDYAVQMGLISDNPCKRAKFPVAKQTEKECYTLEEAQQFVDLLIAKAPIVYKCYFLLAIYGGFRRGELCGLTWDNIDFDNCIVSVRKTLNYVSGGLVIDTPKTKKSERSLKLPSEIFAFLRLLQEFYDEESNRLLDVWYGSDNEFVFKNHKGEPLSPQTPLLWLKNFCEQEGMRKVSIHSFRHLNASLLISNGVDVKTVQACLGHSQASTTMNIYAHSFMEAQAKASEAVANSFDFTKTKEQSQNQV